MEARLTSRNAAILDAIVERYVVTGQPVGSLGVAEDLRERLSPATIRNVMAELERLGYLRQPHTSAGRQPTEKGYRLYVDRLVKDGRLHPMNEAGLRCRLAVRPIEIAEVLQRTCRILAELSDQVGMVLIPMLSDTVFQHVDYVHLEGSRVLAIVVARSGLVGHQVITLQEELGQEDLNWIAGYLERRFGGRPLREVSRRLLELVALEVKQPTTRRQTALALGARSFGDELDVAEVFVEGASSLVRKPEFQEPERLQQVFEAIEERSRLVSLLANDPNGPGLTIRIGTGKLPRLFERCTLITARYHAGDRPVGTVGVLGPTRMHYARTIAVVETMARATSSMLSEIDS